MSQWASLPEPRTSSPDFGDEHDELIDDDDAGATLAARHGDATRASQAIHASMSSATISNSSARKRKLPPVTDAGHGASKRPRGPDVLNYDPGRYPGRASGHASAHAQPSNSTSTLGSASKAQKPAAAVAAHGQRRHTIAQDVIVLSDSDDNDDRGGLPPDSHRRKTIAGTENVVLRGPATHQQAGSHGGAAALVIDLTLDSDDDAVLPSSVPPSTSRLPARSADYDPELEHDSPLPMDVVVEMRKESGPSLPTPGPSSTRTTARPLSSATSHGVESARAAAGNPPDKPSEKPIEGEEHLGKNQKPTYEVDKILKHWSGPFKITDDDLLPRWEFNCKFCSSIRTFPRRKSCATYSDEHPRPMGIMGLRQHLRDKHPAVLRKAIDGVEPMDSDNDAVLPSSVPPSTSLLPARSADPEPEPDSPLPMDVVAETRKESEPSLPTPGLSSTRSTARPLSSATSHRVESARAPAGSLPDKPSEKPIEGEQGENRTRTYEVDEILKHWSGPFKITDDDLLPRWEFNCKFCPSIRTFPRRKSCATYFDEHPRSLGITDLRRHIRDKHPAVLRKAMDGVEPMDSDNDAVLPSSVPPSTSLLPAPSADPQPEPEPDSPLPMDVVAETRKENEPSLPTPGLSSTRSTARPLSSATSHHVESARAAAGSPPDKPNEKPIESEETHAYKVDEILKHWSTPIKMIDTHFLPRWKFNCKFCSSTRTFTRTESCTTYFDEHPRPRGIYNLRQHFVEMHPAVLSEGDGPGATADQPVVAATTTKPVKRAKNYILKFWSVPRKATSNTPRWAFDCKLCSSTRTVPRDERCETFFDEKPQPDLLGLYQHTDERHPDTEEKLAALEVPQSSQSGARVQLKFSRYWSHERATVDAGGRLRWAFDCKFCESTQTVARTAGVEDFYDEHPRPAIGNLMTHTKVSHPDADEKLKVDYVEHVARYWDGPVKVEQQWKFKCKRCPTLFHVAGSDDWQDKIVVRQLWWLVRHMHVEHPKAMDADGSTAASTSSLSHEQPKSTPQHPQRVPAAATNAPELKPVQEARSTQLPEDVTAATSRSRHPPTPPPDTHPTPDTRASTSAKSPPASEDSFAVVPDAARDSTTPLHGWRLKVDLYQQFWSEPSKTVDKEGRLRWRFTCKTCKVVRTVLRDERATTFRDQRPYEFGCYPIVQHIEKEHPNKKLSHAALLEGMKVQSREEDHVQQPSVALLPLHQDDDDDGHDQDDDVGFLSSAETAVDVPSLDKGKGAPNTQDAYSTQNELSSPVAAVKERLRDADGDVVADDDVVVEISSPARRPLRSPAVDVPRTPRKVTSRAADAEVEQRLGLSPGELRALEKHPEQDHALAEAARRIRWPAEELNIFYNTVQDMKAWCSKDPDLRDVFLSIIQQNTLNDEPDAAAITISNTVDDDPCPPWEFAYTNRVLYGHGVRRGDKSKLQGCGCVGGCSATSASCACLQRQRRFFQLGGNDFKDYGFNYNADGQVLDYRFPVFECNDECGCDPEICLNRVTQRGRRYDIEIVKTPRKGWGVFAKSDIPMHSFVGVYSGELITDKESHLRSDFYDRFGRNYMFTLDMWYLKKKARRKYHKMFGAAGQSFQQFLEDEDKQPGDEEVDQNPSFTVDAFHAGNFTRFLNHCCDPNCVIVAVHIDEPHIRKPHLCIFTRRAVACDEELTFSYFGIDDDEKQMSKRRASFTEEDEHVKGMDCFCGADNCVGRFFRV